nr:MAG TPA: hypothetical protein [Caudoviricetes sp.]
MGQASPANTSLGRSVRGAPLIKNKAKKAWTY